MDILYCNCVSMLELLNTHSLANYVWVARSILFYHKAVAAASKMSTALRTLSLLLSACVLVLSALQCHARRRSKSIVYSRSTYQSLDSRPKSFQNCCNILTYQASTLTNTCTHTFPLSPSHRSHRDYLSVYQLRIIKPRWPQGKR